MFKKRTDLALEAQELWKESAERTSRLPGVKAVKRKQEGYAVTEVRVLDGKGAEALGKPVGSYRTVDLTGFWQRRPDFFPRAVRTVGTELREVLPALQLFGEIDESLVADDALIREFIGGGIYEY